MEVLIFLIVFVIAAFAWERVAKKLGANGKGFFVRHLAGLAIFSITAIVCMIVAVLTFPDLGKPAEQSGNPQAASKTKPEQASALISASKPAATPVPTQVASKPVAASAAKSSEAKPIEQPVAHLGLDFETWKSRVITDFQSADLPFAIPDNTELEKSGDNDARKVHIIQLDTGISAVVAIDPATDKITSVMVNMVGSNDGVKNIQNSGAAAIMLAAVAGDNGEKTVGGKIIKMFANTVERFSKKPNDENAGKEKFVENGVKYGVLISKVTPIMLYAEPDQDTSQTKNKRK